MRHAAVLLNAFAIVPAVIFAQSDDRLPKSGRIVIQVDPSDRPNSLDQLVSFSPLVIEATVASNLKKTPFAVYGGNAFGDPGG
jgi:hypothetical protein